MSLKQLPESTAKLITTSQVITSVSSVVKELFENSIDAGATNIEVILENNGLDRIEIRDDGRGINAQDTKFMCLSGYTSKISSFEDLSGLTSYGFRGEALSSLCHIADITITTRTADDEYAMTYNIDKLGEIKSSKPSHHGIGTQVTVINLFKNLPVRRQYISNTKTATLEAKKAEHIVKSLAIINPGIRVTFVNNKMHLCSKPVEATLKKSAIQVLGYRIISKCEELTYNTEEVQLYMLVPNKNCSNLGELCQNSTDYIFIYFNKRAVTHKKIQKEVTKSVSGYFADKFPARKHPTSIVSITVPPNVMDVNLEPNKTKVLCKIEDVILNLVQKVLSDYYDNIDVPVSETNEDKAPVKRTKSKVDVQTEEESVAKRSRVTPYSTSIPLDRMGTPAIHTKNSSNSLHDQERQKSLNLPSHKNISMLNQPDTYNEFVNDIAAINFSTPATSKDHTSPGNSFIPHTDDNETEKYDYVNKGLTEPCIEIEDNLNINNEKTIHDSPSSLEEIVSIRENINLFPNKESNINQTMLANQQHAGNMASINQSEIISDWVREVNSNKSAADNFPLLLSDESEVFFNIDLNPSSPENNVKSNDQVENDGINIDNITREDWSKGHVKNSKGELLQGPVVLLTGPPKIKKYEFQNLSYHSVSSQMGCKEQNGFTKFSRIRRPKIIAENPGISFTRVAALLAEEWKKLSNTERFAYENDEKKCDVNISKHNKSPSLNNKNSNNTSVIDLLRSPNCGKVQKCDVHQSCGTISCSIDEIKEEMNYFANCERLHCVNDNISLIGQLRPSGVWLYKKDSEIGVLKQWALQETVLFHRMMSEHTVPLIALEEKIRVKPKALGEELWQILTSLQQSFDPFVNNIVISSPCITKNGFKIEIIEGPTDNSVFITHVAGVCRFYGINELWDLLSILKEKGPNCTLYQSRPVKIVNYFKSESVRKCRESPVVMELHVLEDILNYWKEKMKTANPKCLHDKPIFEPFYKS